MSPLGQFQISLHEENLEIWNRYILKQFLERIFSKGFLNISKSGKKIMGKSKFQSKIEKKIETRAHQTKGRHVYYDEKIDQKGPGMSKGIFVLLIGIMIIGAGTGSYFLFGGNTNNDDDTDTSSTTTTTSTTTTSTTTTTTTITFTGEAIQEGDHFKAHFKLWVADEPGTDGVTDTSATPVQDSTFDEPFEFSTDDVIEGFKNNVLGMRAGEERTFTLEVGEGYPAPHELAFYRLTFWVYIFEVI